jgi:hypothetical protein
MRALAITLIDAMAQKQTYGTVITYSSRQELFRLERQIDHQKRGTK